MSVKNFTYMPIRVAYISFVGIHVGVNISLIVIRYVMDRCEQNIGLYSVAKMGVKFHRHRWCFWALCSTLQKPSVANEVVGFWTQKIARWQGCERFVNDDF